MHSKFLQSFLGLPFAQLKARFLQLNYLHPVEKHFERHLKIQRKILDAIDKGENTTDLVNELKAK